MPVLADAPEYVSVLFSEPKIPQFRIGRALRKHPDGVSVLFSEPKIPQWRCCLQGTSKRQGFSALQRAENSSIRPIRSAFEVVAGFSALQRAENSSIGLA